MTIYIPYTYYIQWSKTGMKYYGVRYAQSCNPKDFWIDYFTSSKYVEEYVKEHGDPDIRQIRKTFSCANRAIKWEHRVLKNLKVIIRDDYLNKTDNKAIALSDPKVKERLMQGMLAGNKKPESFANRSAGQKEAQNRPELLEIKRQTKVDNWIDPLWRQRQIERITAAMSCPATKERMSIAQKTLWTDEYRQSQLEIHSQFKVKEAQRKAKIGSKNPNHDNTLYCFRHISGNIEQLTKYEFRTAYNISWHYLGKILSGLPAKDWSLIAPYLPT